MLFSFKMAWAYFSKIWQRGIWGVMVLISIIGITLGVASLVVTLSVMNGFHSEITSKLLSLNPHIIVMNPFLGIMTIDNVEEAVKGIDVIRSYTSFIYGKGLLHHMRNSHGAVIKGVDPSNRKPKLVEGSWDKLDADGIVLGSEIADILNLQTGDSIYLIIPKIDNIAAPLIPRVEKFNVAGIFSSGIYEYDSQIALIDITHANNIFSDMTYSSGVELYLDDPFSADDKSQELRNKLKGKYFSVKTWKDRNYNLFAALKLEKAMMFIVLIMIVLVATFNIAGTLIMISVTRSKDCGIMRALGATKRQIRMMFNFKGLLIGTAGTITGTGTGILIGLLLKKYQFIHLPPKVYLISTMPVNFSFQDITIIALTSLAVSYLATIYPAIRAGKLQVSQELRSE